VPELYRFAALENSFANQASRDAARHHFSIELINENLSGVDFGERARVNQARLRFNVKSHYDFRRNRETSFRAGSISRFSPEGETIHPPLSITVKSYGRAVAIGGAGYNV